jgi:hypothetical protein
MAEPADGVQARRPDRVGDVRMGLVPVGSRGETAPGTRSTAVQMRTPAVLALLSGAQLLLLRLTQPHLGRLIDLELERRAGARRLYAGRMAAGRLRLNAKFRLA